jgi:hypothetical protein
MAFGVVDRVKAWLKPAVETVPGFQVAVRQVDNGEFNRARPALRDFVAEYPESVLPRLYLSFALDGWKDAKSRASRDTEISPQYADFSNREKEADDLLVQVMGTPNVSDTLIAWAKGHPEIASHLEDAGHARFRRVDRITRDPDYDPHIAEEYRRLLYHRVKPAIELAAELNPESIVAPRLLAVIEEMDGEYWSAYQRLTRVIESATLRGGDEAELYRVTMVRVQAATKLADQHRDNPPDVPQPFELMRQAVKDLESSEHYVRAHGDNEQILFVLANKATAFLTLSEIETSLMKFPEAKEHLRVASDTLDQVEVRREKSFKFRHLLKGPQYRERVARIERKLRADRVEGGQPGPGTSRAPSAAKSQAMSHR